MQVNEHGTPMCRQQTKQIIVVIDRAKLASYLEPMAALALVDHLVFAFQHHEEVVHVAVAMGAHDQVALLKASLSLEVALVKTSTALGVLL